MKTIIIPAYNGAECIDQLKVVLNVFPNDQLHCIFVQVRSLPDNYNDLMTMRKKSGKYQFFNESFIKGLSLIKNQNSGRITFKTDYIYGDSPAVFRNYVKHHEADLVVYDNKEWKTEKQLNIFRMVRRCGAELMYISRENNIINNSVSAVPRWQSENAPESVTYSYSAIDQQLDNLNDIFNGDKIISKKINNLSRYFLNEAFLQKMLMQSGCSLLLLRK